MNELKPGQYVSYDNNPPVLIQKGEMSLRDYFAAKALNAFIVKAPEGTTFGVSHTETNDNFAIASYAMADAMLRARVG